MPRAHRDNDFRVCGGQTQVIGQTTVWVNNKLWSVDGDPEKPGNHAGAPNKPVYPPRNVWIENKRIICSPAGDTVYSPDGRLHGPGPADPYQASPNTWVYEKGPAGGTAINAGLGG